MLVHSQNTKIKQLNNVKNTALHCIISTLWCNRIVFLKCLWQYSLLPICTLKLRKCPKICIWCNFQSQVLFFRCTPERAVLKLRWFSNLWSHTILREEKSTCGFSFLVNYDASVFEYPQDVHTREAKIYSPGVKWKKMKSNLITPQRQERLNQSFSIRMQFAPHCMTFVSKQNQYFKLL